MGRRAFAIVAAVAALAVLAVVVLRLYLGTDRGRRAVENKLDETVARPIGGHISFGKLGGTLVDGVTLDDVEWKDDAGRPFLRARRVVVHGSAARALAHRPSLTLRVEGPEIDLDRLGDGIDVDEAARLAESARDRVDSLALERVEIVDGTVHAAGHTFRRVELSGSARLERRQRLGDEGEVRIERLAAQAAPGSGGATLGGGGSLAWDGRGRRGELARLSVQIGDSRAIVDGSIAPDAVDLRLEELRVSPDDLRRLSPRADAPRRPIAGSARAHGPPGRIMVNGVLRPDRGRILLSGSIDAERGQGVLRAALDGVQAESTPAVLGGQLELRGELAGGELRAAWTATGRYSRREIDPNLQPAAGRTGAVVRPGGRFEGKGQLTVRPGAEPAARMHFRLSIDDPGQAARLIAGPELRAAAQPFVVEGDWQMTPGRGATMTTDVKRGSPRSEASTSTPRPAAGRPPSPERPPAHP